MQIKNIAIVGGGTAALVTALMLRQTYPKIEIDLIESKKIGIIGVGEGSTEHWMSFMTMANISLSRMIKETDATFKYGINFVNWNGDDTNYIHSVSSAFNVESQTRSKFIYAHIIANGGTPKDIVHNHIEASLHKQPFWGINQFHFDTFKLNTFLHTLCQERNIGVIDAEIEDIAQDENGYITSLRSNDGRVFAYDFYIDSTGFARFIMEKKLGVKWISNQKYLPMNSAIAFPTERTEKIASWTLARAMDCGWLWRIPTQQRHGNGYVFCDQFIDFDRAQEEVEKLYGHKIEPGRKIKFDAGRLDKSWYKNCAAIGLSSSFIEPLEASSIGCSIQQVFSLCKLLPCYVKGNDFAERCFNDESQLLLENILDYIALHYRVKRRDTDFWKSTEDLPLPPGLEEKLELFKHKFPSFGDFDRRFLMFKEANWILVMHGLGLIDKHVAQAVVDMQPDHIVGAIQNNLRLIKMGDPDNEYVDHRTALQWLIDNPEVV